MKTPHYLIANAEDRGRDAAYDFVVARRRWPLLGRPRNPFTGDDALALAWSSEFEKTVARHTSKFPTGEAVLRER